MENHNKTRFKNSVPALFRGGFIAIFLIVFANACEKEKKFPEDKVPGKLVLVCDDWNVDNWYSYLDSFEK